MRVFKNKNIPLQNINKLFIMNKRKIASILLLFTIALGLNAQKKDFKFQFYGQVRADIFYNSRTSQEMIDGLFYLYPLNKELDADGKDLNARTSGNFYILCTRLGLNVEGPKLGAAKTFAKIEGDFRGAGSDLFTFRIRHAYFQLNWEKSDLLVGQTWHPMFGEVYPQVQNISTGAPFQPFSRAPQMRYRYNFDGFQVIGAFVWQSQFSNIGPGNARSVKYLKNSCVPEIYAGLNYRNGHWLAGVGLEFLSIMPRTQTSVTTDIDNSPVNKIYKTSARITTLSYEAYVRYTSDKWFIAAKSIYGSNLTQLCMLGGYGVKTVDPLNDKQTYSPYRISSTWFNAVYGKKWRPGVFLGYSKNMGTAKTITDTSYGLGLNIKQLTQAGVEFSYNVPHWSFGVEYSATSAWYGKNKNNGKVYDTNTVTNNRIVGVAMFIF